MHEGARTMRIELGMTRGKRGNRKLTLMRRAMTTATNKYGIGGRPKTIGKPRPITMPKLKCLEGENDA
jgi:hypothetical protein